MGGSMGKNKSKSSNQFQQSVWQPQGDALNKMYGQASDQFDKGPAYQSQMENQANAASPYMNQVRDQNQQMWQDQSQGGAFGDVSDIRDRLLAPTGQSNTSKMYESIVGGPGNTYIDPMVDAMRSDATENMNNFRGDNSFEAMMNGASGGSRQAMENAMMARDLNKDLTTAETNLRGNNYDKDLGMKMDIARQADTNTQADRDRMLSMMEGANNNRNAAVAGGQQLQALGLGGMAPWSQMQSNAYAPLQNYVSALQGSPTVLGAGSGSGKSKGFGMSGGLFGG